MIIYELEACRQYSVYHCKHFLACRIYLFFPSFLYSSVELYPYQLFCCFCIKAHSTILLLVFKSFHFTIQDVSQQILLPFHKWRQIPQNVTNAKVPQPNYDRLQLTPMAFLASLSVRPKFLPEAKRLKKVHFPKLLYAFRVVIILHKG